MLDRRPLTDRGPAMPPLRDDGDEPLSTLVGRVVDDTRALAAAEVELYKARVAERVTAYKGAAIFFAVAGVLALAALIAALVGAILSLATLIGPGLATLAVVAVVLAIAGILGWLGSRRLAPAEAKP